MIRVALPFGIGTPEIKRDSYRIALRAAGIEPVENVTTLDGLNGVMLAGGNDVDPALYGAARQPETEHPDPDRDAIESMLIREAVERDLPLLAICRGLQLVNVALGGTLLQHVEGHDYRKQRDVHDVAILQGSRLESILGGGAYVVNSRHHQAAANIAPGLIVTAAAPDGIVEAIEIPEKRFALAVQWHPEARIDGSDARLFTAFRDAMS